MNRNLLGIIAAVLLFLGGVTHFMGPGGNSASGFAGGCIRVGLVLGALWLALPNILATAARMPGWLLGWFIKKQLPQQRALGKEQQTETHQQSTDKQQRPPVIQPPRPRRRSNA